MDFKIPIKQENNDFEKEDSNDNYLKFDFEIGVKIENDSPTFDWCLQNTKYQDRIIYEDVKEECEIQTCYICLRMFADSHALYQHNLTHLNVVLIKPSCLYQCEHCSCYCMKKSQLIEHIHSKHFMIFRNKNGPLSQSKQRCVICNKTYSYNNWHGHMTEVHGSTRFECGDCGASYKCMRKLNRHIQYVHRNVKANWRCYKDEKIKCELCPSVLRHRSAFKTHMRNCHSDKVHECNLCHSKLKTKSYLLAHIKRVHYNDGKMHPCNICHKLFKSPRYMRIHIKNSHSKQVKTMKSAVSSTKTNYSQDSLGLTNNATHNC